MFLPLHDDNPLRRFPIWTVLIILLNFGGLMVLLRANDHERRVIVARHGFVPQRLAQLSTNRPILVDLYRGEREVPPGVNRLLVLPPNPAAICISLVTCMFLHAGWMHLIGNMWFFWLFGNNIEDRLGRILFPLFYLTGGILATVCHWLVSAGAEMIPIIGASGAVAVMLGAYLVTYPTARVKTLVFIIIFITVVELPAGLVLAVWLLLQLLDGVKAVHLGIDGGVAWWAHIGGFGVGMLLMPILSAGSDPGDKDWRFEGMPERPYLDPSRSHPPQQQQLPDQRLW